MINTLPKKVGTVKELMTVSVKLKTEDVHIRYSLVEAEALQRVYLITLSLESESETVFAGKDKHRAGCLFDALVNGEVTPCTAEEVARDLLQMLCDEK